MKTPGFLTDSLFYLRALTIISVLSIGLQILNRVGNTLEENTSGRNENLEVRVGELQVKATGKNTTDRVLNLLLMLSDLVEIDLEERSYPYTPPLDRQTLQKLENSSLEVSLPKQERLEHPTITTPTF